MNPILIVIENAATKAAHDALATAIAELDTDQGKAALHAVEALAFAAVKAGIDAALPPFLRQLADMGLDSAEVAVGHLIDSALDRAAAAKPIVIQAGMSPEKIAVVTEAAGR